MTDDGLEVRPLQQRKRFVRHHRRPREAAKCSGGGDGQKQKMQIRRRSGSHRSIDGQQ